MFEFNFWWLTQYLKWSLVFRQLWYSARVIGLAFVPLLPELVNRVIAWTVWDIAWTSWVIVWTRLNWAEFYFPNLPCSVCQQTADSILSIMSPGKISIHSPLSQRSHFISIIFFVLFFIRKRSVKVPFKWLTISYSRATLSSVKIILLLVPIGFSW